LSARSVIASTLLGIEPPRLPSQVLARSGELFGISEGTTRVALSRMIAAGELELDDGSYRLAGELLNRHARQSAGRRAEQLRWSGQWVVAVVVAERRAADERASLREAMRRLKMAALREGVWLRPDNLAPERDREALALTLEQCQMFRARPQAVDLPRPSPRHPVVADDRAAGAELAAGLWDLAAWRDQAERMRREMAGGLRALETGDTDGLADAFVLSAAVLRHLIADPLLPGEILALLPRAGTWPGPALRTDYERYDRAFKSVWRSWFRTQS
jgi:phenylacetic acid degradation operon negative regulatory protein